MVGRRGNPILSQCTGYKELDALLARLTRDVMLGLLKTCTGIGADSLSKDRASEIEVQVKDNEGFLRLTVTAFVVARRAVRALD